MYFLDPTKMGEEPALNNLLTPPQSKDLEPIATPAATAERSAHTQVAPPPVQGPIQIWEIIEDVSGEP